jgi:hypothetical protein
MGGPELDDKDYSKQNRVTNIELPGLSRSRGSAYSALGN